AAALAGTSTTRGTAPAPRGNQQDQTRRHPLIMFNGKVVISTLSTASSHGPRPAIGRRAGYCPVDSDSATPLVQPKPSWVGYSPPPAGLVRSSTSYFSVILPVAA